MTELSNNIKYYRKLNNMTQESFAKLLGVAPTAVSAWELARNKPLMDNVERMASIFKISKSQLLGETDSNGVSSVLKSDIDPRFKSKQDYYSVNSPHFDDVLTLHKNLTVDRHGVWIQHGNKLLEEQEREKQKQQALEEQVTKLSDVAQELFDYDFYDSAVSAGTGQFLNEAKRETISLPIDLPADFVIPVYGDSMEPEYHSGDYVFVKLTVDIASGDIGIFDLCGESYIKKIIIDDDKAYLHSLNSEYKDIPINTDSDFRVIGKVIGKYSEKQ